MCVTFTVGITFSVVITFSGDTNIVKFKIQLSSKDFRPKLPEWPKGRIFEIDTQEQWETALPQIISHQREMIGKSCSDCCYTYERT